MLHLVVNDPKPIIIALDAMGGDNAPSSVMEGAEIVLRKRSDIRLLIYGNQTKLQPFLDTLSHVRAAATVIHTETIVSSDEKPSHALRHGKNSSMQMAINAVKDGQAHAVVSSGNTGALMAMAKLSLRMLPGIDRPAIISTIPTLRGKSAMIDMGANVECSAEHLFQFAIMGDVYARIALNLERPLLGILNVGSEELKGNDAVKQAAEMIRACTLPLNLYGFIEGNDLLKGTVDVIVTDGFTGNIALKTAEGTAKIFGTLLRNAFESSFFSRLGALLCKKQIAGIVTKMDPRSHNGAMFIGINGVAVKSHGSADKKAFANALEMAINLAKQNVNQLIIEEMKQYHPLVSKPAPSGSGNSNNQQVA